VAQSSAAARPIARSPIRHAGKRVSTTLKVRTGASLSGRTLELRMEPGR
jgi:hypothetical protein